MKINFRPLLSELPDHMTAFYAASIKIIAITI